MEAFYITPLFPKLFGLVRPLELLWLRPELNLLREMFSRIINAIKSFTVLNDIIWKRPDLNTVVDTVHVHDTCIIGKNFPTM